MKTIYTPAHLAHAPAKEFLDGELVDVFEKPTRAELILTAVRDANLGQVLPPKDFGLAPIQAIHSDDYLDYLQHAYALWLADGRGTNAVYPDTFWKPQFLHRPTKIGALAGIYSMDMSAPITGGTWHAAYQSAQVALTAAELVRDHRSGDGERAAFALCRPPGHHADVSMAGGYCYLNNVAIAAEWLRAASPPPLTGRGAGGGVAILDIDIHHGNGTQSIFYTRNDVLFVSLHGDPDWQYPYFLGGKDEVGEGEGTGYTLNYPLPKGTTNALFLDALNDACNRIGEYKPAYLLISLGADTFEADPLGGFALTSAAYAEIGARIAQLNLPTVFIMEGGYAIAQLGQNVANVLKGFEGRIE
jgi:acetoin utilization deacetylase AcuC-like enzyme